MDMKLIELMVLDMENKELGVDAISLVTEPAIEVYRCSRVQMVLPSGSITTITQGESLPWLLCVVIAYPRAY